MHIIKMKNFWEWIVADKNTHLKLILVIIIGAIFRIANLGTQSLWYDEAASFAQANQDIVNCLLADYNHPPLHRLFLHFWLFLFSNNEFSLRFPSVIFGLFSIYLTYKLAAKLFDSKIGLISAVLLSVSPFHIYFSQESRMYSLAILLVLWSNYLFFCCLEKDKSTMWIGYVIVSLLGLYTYYLFGLIIFAHNVFIIFNWKKYSSTITKLILSQAIMFLLYAPWLLLFLMNIGSQERSYTTDFLIRIPYVFFTFSLGYSAIITNYIEKLHMLQTMKNNILIILLSILIYVPLFLNSFRYYSKNKNNKSFLFVLAFFPFLVLLLLWVKIPLLSERYLAFILPLYYIILGIGLVSFHNKNIRVCIILGLLALTSFSLKNYYFNSSFGKEEWRGVATHIMNSGKDGDIILFHKDYVATPFNYYYVGNLTQYGIPEQKNFTKDKNIIEIRDIFKKNRSTILGGRSKYILSQYSHNASHNEGREFRNFLEDHCKRVWLILAKNYDTELFYRDVLAGYFTQSDEMIFPKMNGITVYLFTKRDP